jgi:hypothetical protein
MWGYTSTRLLSSLIDQLVCPRVARGTLHQCLLVVNQVRCYNPSNASFWFTELVGGLEHFFSFHIWDVIPTPLTNSIIFQRGRSTTNPKKNALFFFSVAPLELHSWPIPCTGHGWSSCRTKERGVTRKSAVTRCHHDVQNSTKSLLMYYNYLYYVYTIMFYHWYYLTQFWYEATTSTIIIDHFPILWFPIVW